MSDVTVTRVARDFAEYVNRVAYRRESFTLLRGKKLVAELRPPPTSARLSELPGLLASPPRLTDAKGRRVCRRRRVLALGARRGTGRLAVLMDASILIEAERGRLHLEPHIARHGEDKAFLSVVPPANCPRRASSTQPDARAALRLRRRWSPATCTSARVPGLKMVVREGWSPQA